MHKGRLILKLSIYLGGKWKIWSTTGIEENEDPRYALPKCLQLVLCGIKEDSQPILLQPQSEYAFQIGEIDQFKVSHVKFFPSFAGSFRISKCVLIYFIYYFQS